jgi:hypothetical protein
MSLLDARTSASLSRCVSGLHAGALLSAYTGTSGASNAYYFLHSENPLYLTGHRQNYSSCTKEMFINLREFSSDFTRRYSLGLYEHNN